MRWGSNASFDLGHTVTLPLELKSWILIRRTRQQCVRAQVASAASPRWISSVCPYSHCQHMTSSWLCDQTFWFHAPNSEPEVCTVSILYDPRVQPVNVASLVPPIPENSSSRHSPLHLWPVKFPTRPVRPVWANSLLSSRPRAIRENVFSKF